MIDRKPITVGDRERYRSMTEPLPDRNSFLSFGIPFLWGGPCRQNIVTAAHRLCMEWVCTEHTPFFTFPLGPGELRAAVEELRSLCRELGRPLELRYVDEVCRAALEAACPGEFVFTEDPSTADYLYELKSLATLSGKKLHAKRNWCNRFEKLYPHRCETLTRAHFDDCHAVFSAWAKGRTGTAEERTALERAFADWDALGLEGWVLYAGDVPAAFSVGERLTEDCFDIHFEKARDEFPGAYPMITREVARSLLERYPELRYVNREEDMGLPNLRTAKEEWFPCGRVRKYIVRETDTNGK